MQSLNNWWFVEHTKEKELPGILAAIDFEKAFMLSTGVHQGDPLARYPFMIALETLAIKIINDDSIKALKLEE